MIKKMFRDKICALSSSCQLAGTKIFWVMEWLKVEQNVNWESCL